VAVGDFNNDGQLDLGVGTSVGCGCEEGYRWGYSNVLLGKGEGSFASPLTTDGYGVPTGVAVADVNGDGNQDLLTADGEAGSVGVLSGNGDGTLQAWSSPYTGGYPWAVAAGDVNGDGKLDLVVATENPTSNNVSVLLGDGLGDFGPARAYASGRHASSVALGDFNTDGVLDITVPNYFDNTLSVLLGRGDGTFKAPLSFAAGVGPTGIVAGDFNGDGRSDVAVGNVSVNAAVAVLLNDGIWDGPPSAPSLRINDVTGTEGNTGTASATFTVTLSAENTETITVAYATANGTATAGSDYQAATGTLTFAPGETIMTVTVLVIGDRLGEPNETFVVNLSSPTNATIADAQGVATIVDDEPRISITDVSRKEGKKGKTKLFTFTVTLSAPPDQPVTVSYQTVNGTAKTSDGDYVAKSGTLTFAPGETTKTITVEVKGDSRKEANESFYVDLFDNSGNALLTRKRGTGTIFNDD
jgi:hypothetical protein